MVQAGRRVVEASPRHLAPSRQRATWHWKVPRRLSKMALDPARLRAYAQEQISDLAQKLGVVEEPPADGHGPAPAVPNAFGQKDGTFPSPFIDVIDSLLDEHHCGWLGRL